VKLDEGITNADHLLGRKGGADFNFHDARFRVYAGGAARDVVIAKTPIKPGVWTHVAATRDGEGRFRLFLNGEMDQDQGKAYREPLKGLHLGDGNVPGGAGWYAELRVWDVNRTVEELRDSYLQSFAGEAAPAGLKHLFVGERWPKLHGGAKVELTRDCPQLLTAAETRKLNEKFARFRELAGTPGDAAKGKVAFQSICLNCHTLGGAGGKIAPALDGLGHTGLEAILRNLLTPNAAVEAGYRSFRVQTRDGDVIDGFLASQDEQAVVIQAPNSEPRRIPRARIRRGGFTNSSLMPEGLLEGLPADQARDLLSYLTSLR
jgi:putative heme-binding domain-containing protein